jgi:hypothetical protein
MKYTFLFFLLFFFMKVAYSQARQESQSELRQKDENRKERVLLLKTQPFQPLIRKYSISAEVQLKNSKSLQLQAAYWDWAVAVELSSVRLNMIDGVVSFNELAGDLHFRNLGFQAEWRAYLTEEAPLEGLYVAPALNVGFARTLLEVADPAPFSIRNGSGRRDFTAIGGSVSVGYQLIFNRLAFDAFLGIGGFYGALHQVELTYEDGSREKVNTSIPRFLPFPRIGLAMGIAF